MSAGEMKMGNAVRWDTNSNKIYFDIERWSLGGQLMLRKSADGQIDMYIIKTEPPRVANVSPMQRLRDLAQPACSEQLYSGVAK